MITSANIAAFKASVDARITSKVLPNSVSLLDESGCFDDLADLLLLASQTQVPDGVIAGLGLSTISQQLTVAPGQWSIAGSLFTTSAPTVFMLAAQDLVLSRFDLVYATSGGALGVVTGMLASNPVLPALPANSIQVGYVLVTPVAYTPVQPILTGYVDTINDQLAIGGNKGFLSPVAVPNALLSGQAVNLGQMQAAVAGGINIYNSNGTLTGNRHLINGAYSLTIDQLNVGGTPTNITGEALGVFKQSSSTSGLVAAFDAQVLASPGVNNSGTYYSSTFSAETAADAFNYSVGIGGAAVAMHHFGSGTVATADGYTILSPISSGGGTITTARGLVVQPLKASGITTGLAIDQQGTLDVLNFRGVPTFYNNIIASGLSAGTAVNYLGVDAGNNVVTTAGAATIYTSNGTLAGSRTVTLGSNNLIFTGTQSPITAIHQINGSFGNILITTNNTTSHSAQLQTNVDPFNQPYALFTAADGVGGTQVIATKNNLLYGSNKGIFVRDSVDNYGLYYAADYSANFTTRSIIDKGFGDSHYNSILGFTPENPANKATDFTILNNTLYPTTQAVYNYVSNTNLPNSVVTGLATTVSGTTATTAAGTYRTNSIIYTIGGSTNTTIPAQDATQERFTFLYGTTLGTLAVVNGALSATAVQPALPANTTLIAIIYIPKTGFTVTSTTQDPQSYVTTGAPNQIITQTPSFQNGLNMGANFVPAGINFPYGGSITGVSQIHATGLLEITGSGYIDIDAGHGTSIGNYFSRFYPSDFVSNYGNISLSPPGSGLYDLGLFTYSKSVGYNLGFASTSDFVFMTTTGPGVGTTGVELFRIKQNGDISTTLPAYSSGTNLAVVYNSTNNRFETNASAGASGTVTSITAGTGLSGGVITTSGTITVNTSQNISTLSNLTANGFVTTSGGTGALSIDTNTYLTTSSATATYLPLAGGVLTGPLTLNADPTSALHPATKQYVDLAVLGQDFKVACKYATTAALPAIVYNNGSSGVGATLTGVGFGAITMDGSTPSVGDRLLIKNQATTFQNGIYTVTIVGTVSTVFVLTRSTDFNQSVEINTGDTTFITTGTANGATTWTTNSTSSPVIGSSAITFAQVAGQGSFLSGNGINISGTSIAIDTTVTVDKTTAQVLTNKDLTSGTNSFPTFNQSTTGSAAKWTTARNLAGNSVDGSGNVAFSNAFIVQGTADAGLSGAQFMGALGTGLIKNTTTTGVFSIAVAADIPALANLTAANTTLTFSGTYDTTAARTIGLNLGNANTWSAVQTFGNNISIGGVTSTGATGTGNNVFSTSPTLTTPVITGLPTGTGVASAATVSTLAARDSAGNMAVNNLVEGFRTQASTATPIVLTVADAYYQEVLGGSTNTTFTLPVAATMQLGQGFCITNQMSGTVTVQSSGGNTIGAALVNGGSMMVYCVLTSGTGTASWDRGVTMGSFTGTGGSAVLSASPTFSGTIAGSVTFSGANAYTGTQSFNGAVKTSQSIIVKTTGTAINTTATVTAAQLAGGLLTSTSAATVTMTLPTATSMGTQIGAAQGTMYQFVVDNTAGANIVTVAVGAGTTAVSAVTGGTTLTVTNGLSGVFLLCFSSATVAQLSRVQ